MTAPEVLELRRSGYRPSDFIAKSETLGRVIEVFRSGFFSPEDPSRGAAVARYLEEYDPFMACADFEDYLRCQTEVEGLYRDRPAWMRSVVQNIAGMGRFSSDETIRRYASDIWGVTPVPVDHGL
jgi:starch phosphorylase